MNMSNGWTKERQIKYPDSWEIVLKKRRESQKGKHYSPKTEFKKGQESFFKGRRHKLSSIEKIKIARTKQIGENHPQWKGNNVQRGSLHTWMNKRLKKPLVCEYCNKIKPLDLANKSQEYRRDVNDWLWLCRKCHHNYDKESYINSYVKGWKTRRRNGNDVPWNKGKHTGFDGALTGVV